MKFAATIALAAGLWASSFSMAAASGAQITPSDVEAFSDGIMPMGLAQGDIAGAVVVVVKDGQVVLAKGYGVSDVKTRAAVDPARTLFRPGSVSKLFVWTAVMQLADTGKIDLDKDVDAYLDFKLPAPFGKPVTMRNLMTHTAGFEEFFRPLLLGDPNRIDPLDRTVKDTLPAQIFPPGQVPAYSNYGATLAGYIVQRVSGERFEDYVQHHIFTPLGMAHATFEQPLPKSLAPDMSKGYQLASGPATPFEMINLAPAGGLSASGGDMARFMIAHLSSGSYGGGAILSPAAAAKMHGVANVPFSALTPMAYGFYHDDMNGHTIVAHGGDTGVFHSELALILDAHTGIFLSMNSAGIDSASGHLRRMYVKGFMDRYFPAPRTAPLPTLKTARADGETVAGAYAVSRRPESNFAAFLYLLSPASVRVNDDATISISLLETPAHQPKRFREIRPFVWQDVNGQSLVQANMRDGHVAMIGMDDVGPIMALQPVGLTNAPWNLWLLIGTLAMFAATVIFWPIKAVLRWRFARPLPYVGRARMLYRLTRVVALIDLVFLAGFPLAFLLLANGLATHTASIDWLWRALQLVGLIGVLGTPIPILELMTALCDRERPWWTKATDALLVAAALATVWFAFSQHLLGFATKY
jgi:CubicO group peptidase (beta-lactamase class C family)